MTTCSQLLRILGGIIALSSGILLGAILGISSALLLATLVSERNAFLWALVFVFAFPIGILTGAIMGGKQARRMLHSWRQEPKGSPVRARLISKACRFGMGSLGGIVAMGVATLQLSQPPSDSKLLSHFERHEATFNQIIQMLQKDKELRRIDENWTSPENPETIGVSPNRLAEYRRILGAVGTPRGFEVQENGIHFFYWISGSSVSSTTIVGFAYLPQPPAETVPRLSQQTCLGPRYRPIHGRWYLYYQYYPG